MSTKEDYLVNEIKNAFDDKELNYYEDKTMKRYDFMIMFDP